SSDWLIFMLTPNDYRVSQKNLQPPYISITANTTIFTDVSGVCGTIRKISIVVADKYSYLCDVITIYAMRERGETREPSLRLKCCKALG
ncbi:MAG: hypothetical protein LUC44_08675, partial [Prevotellaceae bacterium]|nr:hypothetical protein [Prevotellaceae bacterium]